MKHKKDIIIIALALLTALALYLVANLTATDAVTTVVATVDGREVLRRPLVMNSDYEIPGKEGARNVIRVENGQVYMLEANCRDGLCIQQGRMKNTAKRIICLPNGVVISLEGEGNSMPTDDVDVIIQ